MTDATTDTADVTATTVAITLNGDKRTVSGGTTVAAIVTELTGHDPDSDQLGIAVALNSAVVPRSRWSATTLSEGAEVEIITAMQGG